MSQHPGRPDRSAAPVWARQTFVVVSGLPASGKTSLAAALSQEMGLAHLDKDTFLEALFEPATTSTAERRQALSREADQRFRAQAMALDAAVLSSWWRHPKSDRASGTPVDWLSRPELDIIEIHCHVPAAEAVRRFIGRERHPGHLDRHRSEEELRTQFAASEALGPLFPARAIVLDTSRPGQEGMVRALAQEIRQRLSPASRR